MHISLLLLMSLIKLNINKDALLIVDLQNDFCPGGALPIPKGNEVVPLINDLIPHFKHIFTTQDWHPKKHISFIEQGGIWPPHCVAGTTGAELHPKLRAGNAIHIKKGYDPDKEAYSGFHGTDLAQTLKAYSIERLFVCGLATDYCVKATVLDALHHGFKVILLSDTIRGVDVKPGDSAAAIDEMHRAGATISKFSEIVEAVPRL
jgi:nicotinamidase-related amidase